MPPELLRYMTELEKRIQALIDPFSELNLAMSGLDPSQVKATSSVLGHLEDTIMKLVNPAKEFTASLGQLQSMASLAINQVTQFVGQIQSQFSQFVGLFDPSAMIRFELAARDLNASIGEALLPVFNRATAVVRGLGDAIAGMSPTAKTMIGGLAASAVAMGVMTVATQAFTAAVASATGGLSLVAGAVVGGLTAIGSVSGTFAEFEKAIQPIINTFSTAMDTVGNAFNQVVQAAQPLMTLLSESLGQHLNNVLPIVNQFAAQFAGIMTSFVPVLEAILPPILQVGSAIAQLQAVVMQTVGAVLRPLLTAITPVLQVVGGLVSAVSGVFSAMATSFQLVMAVVEPLLQAVAAPFQALSNVLSEVGKVFGPVMSQIQVAFTDLGSVFNEISQVLGQTVRELLGAGFELLQPMVDVFLAGVTKIAGVMLEVVRWVEEFTAGLRDLLGLEPPRPRNVKDASQGKAIRDVSSGSVEDYIRRAQQAAFSIGSAEEPTKQTAKNTGGMVSIMRELAGDVREMKGKVENLVTIVSNGLGQIKDAASAPVRVVQQAGNALVQASSEARERVRRAREGY